MTDGGVHNQTRRAVRTDNNPQLPHNRDPVTLAKFGITATGTDFIQPACSLQQIVHDGRTIQGRLPGGFTVLQGNGRNIGRVRRRKQYLASRNRESYAQRHTFMQKRKEIGIRVLEDERESVPQVKAERLIGVAVGSLLSSSDPREAAPWTWS